MKYLLVVLIFITPALAEGVCSPKDQLLDLITGQKYREVPFLILGGSTGARQLFVNLVTGSWTIIGFPTALPNMACVLDTGIGIKKAPLPEIRKTPL